MAFLKSSMPFFMDMFLKKKHRPLDGDARTHPL
jgi:hypothetical protein